MAKTPCNQVVKPHPKENKNKTHAYLGVWRNFWTIKMEWGPLKAFRPATQTQNVSYEMLKVKYF